MHNKVYLFIAVSALIHISAYGIITQSTNTFMPVEHGRSAISVEITQSKNTFKKQVINKPEKHPEKNIPTEDPDKSVQSTASVISKPVIDPTNNINAIHDIKTSNDKASEITEAKSVETLKPSNEVIDDKADEVNTKAIIAVLREELSKHFYYPASAQRKNWEGQVVLSFIILPDGIIDEIHINKSSGYDVLDDAAIEALAEVKSHDALALALGGNSHEQLLPVTYRLTD